MREATCAGQRGSFLKNFFCFLRAWLKHQVINLTKREQSTWMQHGSLSSSTRLRPLDGGIQLHSRPTDSVGYLPIRLFCLQMHLKILKCVLAASDNVSFGAILWYQPSGFWCEPELGDTQTWEWRIKVLSFGRETTHLMFSWQQSWKFKGTINISNTVWKSGRQRFGLTSLLDSLALFKLVGFVVVRQRNGVAVFVAEDAARVTDVGHSQLLVRQQGHQTRRTWRGEREEEQKGKEGTQADIIICLKNEMSFNCQIGNRRKKKSGSISLGTFCSDTLVSIWNCTLWNLS